MPCIGITDTDTKVFKINLILNSLLTLSLALPLAALPLGAGSECELLTNVLWLAPFWVKMASEHRFVGYDIFVSKNIRK